MNLVDRLRLELEVRRMAVRAAIHRITLEEREASKDKRSVPRHLMDQLQTEVRYAKENVYACEAALCGASRFPPLPRSL